MASENSAVVDAPITKGIEERMKDLGVEDKSLATTKNKDGGAPSPAHQEEGKKETDVQEKSVTESKTDKAEEKKIEKDEVSKEEEEKAKEVEVAVPSVDHRSYGGDEGKREDVPTTVVHEIHPKQETPSQGIFYTVGTKVLSTATTIKDAIIGKSNNSK